MRLSHHLRVLPLLFSGFFSVWSASLPALSPQAGSASAITPSFAGAWQATFEGKTIIVLKLQGTSEPVSGSIRLAGFQLDMEGNGALMAVTDSRLDSALPLKNLKREGSILSFDFVDRDGDNDKFQMELTGPNSAKLQWLGLPNGFKAQPIPMTRLSAASPKTN